MIKRPTPPTLMEDADFRLSVIQSLVKLESANSKLRAQLVHHELTEDLERKAQKKVQKLTEQVIEFHHVMRRLNLPESENKSYLRELNLCH